MKIHPTAFVDPKAELAEGVIVGNNVNIGPDVKIGPGTEIGPNVVIDGWTTIGAENRIFPGAVIGLEPQVVGYKKTRAYVEIGDRNVFREYCSVHRSMNENGKTIIGNDNYLMSFVHVAHDVIVHNNVILVNYTSLTGHVEVADKAIVSGMTGVHQNTRIGKMAMVGAFTKVTKDVPPYFLADGYPAKIHGLNSVGLKRNGISIEARKQLKAAFKLLYKSGLNVSAALDRIESTLPDLEEINGLVRFVRDSKRGITGLAKGEESDD